MFDLITIGHFAIDTILSPKINQPRPTLGGSATYVSVAVAKLGVKVSVVSKVGGDFPDEYLKWLRNNNVDLSGLKSVPNALTTRYWIKYGDSERRLRLQAMAPMILPADFPSDLCSNVIHIAPIAGEVSAQTVFKARKCAEILSLDPQGFVRTFDKKGNVALKQWLDSGVLGQIDVFKSAAPEVKAMTKARDVESAMRRISDHGVKTVIVTRGIEGSELFFEERIFSVPAYKPKVLVDPTGAGDAYIGAFLAEYTHTRDVLWCASVGSASASFVVEGVGPGRFGEREEVYERAQTIYEKVAGRKK
jgi:sugar/nucleoside kinase (ribokinase family)